MVTQGEHLFGRFKDEVMQRRPTTDTSIPLHKTDVYPLPAMDIDESSTAGNADVLEQILKETSHDMADGPGKNSATVKVWWGDQLSVARLREASWVQVGHDSLIYSLLDGVFGPGLFTLG